VQWSWFRRFLYLGSERLVRLTGVKRSEITRLILAPKLVEVLQWSQNFGNTLDKAASTRRWIPKEVVEHLISSRPTSDISSEIKWEGIKSELSPEEATALERLRLDVEQHIARANEQILRHELKTEQSFFETIENKPLTFEQAKAVITFDNRVQVVAAAGSGKTSVMVARAAYATHRGFVSPERILLLAFNKAAADELQQRVQQRLTATGIDPTGIRASTFHSFGLDVIGKASGARPRPAPWLETGRDLPVLQEIVDHLRDSSPDFRYKWDLFRLLFANVDPSPAAGDHDHYDPETRETGFSTFNGKYVRSHGERLIANWLYLNGVTFEYERQYAHRTASAEYSQYRPDFYYPDADLWHEHWALDRDGNPPAEFHGYTEGIVWKQQIHRKYGTKLIETTWAEVVHGNGLVDLEAQLHNHGIQTDWDPDRPIEGRQAVRHEQLCRLIRTFMTHIKSNKLDETALARRLSSTHRHLAGTRTSLFLDIYWPIHKEWDRLLQQEEYVDFEDMLSLAADALENNQYDAPFDLILVDELQDASQARARLIRGLTNKPGKFLLAVGDDWQSINRFAGADISVMTDFHQMFGSGPRLELTTTFRCTQRICDVSSTFVSKNPRQLRKRVRAVHSERGPHVLLIRDSSPTFALHQYLWRLSKEIESGEKPGGSGARTTVDVLGRYRYNKEVMPKDVPPNLDVRFRTIHSAKGLEADYIVLANAKSGTYGFPSTIADDQVLDLAMSEADTFEHAEERRLFYVALTRARHQVAILYAPGFESPFVLELNNNPDVECINGEGETTSNLQICPSCDQGALVTREGPYGSFLGCSRFPACRGPKRGRRPSSSGRGRFGP
jgi:DNA helicase-4